MKVTKCPSTSALLAWHSKYVLPLDLRLLQRGTTPAPRVRLPASELAAMYPADVRRHSANNRRQAPALALRLVRQGAEDVELLPAIEAVGSVTSIRRGLAYGRYCTAITPTGEIVAESENVNLIQQAPARPWSWSRLTGRDARRRWQSDITTRRRLPAIRRFAGRVAAMNAVGSHNYYHWLTEILPRFATLRLAGIAADYFLIDCHTEAQRRTLRALGVAEGQLIQPHVAMTVEATELVLPCFPTPACVRSFPEVFKTTLADAKSGLSLRAPRRLFISRRHANTRRLKNEAAVERLLHAYGFETHCLESYGLAEQHHLLRSAEMVVAVHGAGLANLMFARPGTSVIEIVHADRFNRLLFPQLSQAMGLRHTQVIAQRASHKQILSVELAELDLALEGVGRESAAA
ncbi:MAG: glycosyltransferase family 61 protein [Pirellulales bacterium]|nr:glycosyltransferase family 61 protein [Pirellulales bacterium]